MSKRRFLLTLLPTEIMFYIFDFLTDQDILRAFTQLDPRLDDFVRYYVKQVNCNIDWENDHHHFLKWISSSVRKIEIDQYHLHYLSIYKFDLLESLTLVDVDHWKNYVSNYEGLRNLRVWFKRNYFDNFQGEIRIETMERFSTNALINAAILPRNLKHLTLRTNSIIHLIKIIQNTPNVEYLNATIPLYYFHNTEISNYSSIQLTKLKYLCICNTFPIYERGYHYMCPTISENMLLSETSMFIDQYCPNSSILKHVAIKLDYITFSSHLWPTFEKYKKTYDRFDFYVSIIILNPISINTIRTSAISNIGHHTEVYTRGQEEFYYLHIYSLPFAFDTLYGFTSFTDLAVQSSFSSVRYLYFTAFICHNPISFESLAKYMPRIVSINCNFRFFHPTIGNNIYKHVRSCQFNELHINKHAVSHSLLSRLLYQMPYLCNLTLGADITIHSLNKTLKHPLLSVRFLELQSVVYNSFDILPKVFKRLSTLLLCGMVTNPINLSNIVGNLFIKIPSLRVVSFNPERKHIPGTITSYRNLAKHALLIIRTMDNRLQHLDIYESDKGTFKDRVSFILMPI